MHSASIMNECGSENRSVRLESKDQHSVTVSTGQGGEV